MFPLLASLGVFWLTFGVTLALLRFAAGQPGSIEARLADLTKARLGEQSSGVALAWGDNPASAFFKWMKRRIPAPQPNTPRAEKIAQRLLRAGFIRPSALHAFYVIRILTAVAGAALGLVFARLAAAGASAHLSFLLCGAALGLVFPSYYLGRRARWRQGAIARQLSDILDLLTVSVEAGVGLVEAIRFVGAHAERQGQEIGTELALVVADVAAGRSLGEALRSLAERTEVEEIRSLAATLIQSEQLGAPIGAALRASSDALRASRKIRAEEAARKTAVKVLFPVALLVLPAMLIIIAGPVVIQIMRTLATAGR